MCRFQVLLTTYGEQDTHNHRRFLISADELRGSGMWMCVEISPGFLTNAPVRNLTGSVIPPSQAAGAHPHAVLSFLVFHRPVVWFTHVPEAQTRDGRSGQIRMFATGRGETGNKPCVQWRSVHPDPRSLLPVVSQSDPELVISVVHFSSHSFLQEPLKWDVKQSPPVAGCLRMQKQRFRPAPQRCRPSPGLPPSTDRSPGSWPTTDDSGRTGSSFLHEAPILLSHLDTNRLTEKMSPGIQEFITHLEASCCFPGKNLKRSYVVSLLTDFLLKNAREGLSVYETPGCLSPVIPLCASRGGSESYMSLIVSNQNISSHKNSLHFKTRHITWQILTHFKQIFT